MTYLRWGNHESINRCLMRLMKDAHCTESLAQLPPPDEGFYDGLFTRSRRTLCRLVLVCLWGSSPELIAQTDPATAPQVTAPSGEDTAQQAPQTQPVRAPETPLYRSREERDMSLLAEGVDGETAVWLEAMEQPFLALYEQELTGQAVGAVLIINAEGQHSSWPTTSERIRLSLPEFGWNTLSTELPMPEARPIPKRSEPSQPSPVQAPEKDATKDSASERDTASPDKKASDTPAEPIKAEAGEDKEIFDSETGQLSDGSINPETASTSPVPESEADQLKVPAEDIAVARLHAAINYLHQQGQFNIVLMGSGVGALRSVCFLKSIPKLNDSTQARLIRALVIINARNHLPNDDRQLHQCLDTPEMPVLDIYLGQDERDHLEAKTRRKYARRKNYTTYQQLQLPVLASNTMLGENRLSRRVRGFLENYARGIKVDNAVIKKR